jgi:hypothetical protein
MLLLVLSPAPLVQGAASSLFAVDGGESLDRIFQTRVTPRRGQWKYIYIHHSKTAGGNATSLGQNSRGLADHFVIGNGDGCRDGEIQMGYRWNQQLPASPPPGARSIDPSWISICVVGDFDHTAPTQMQLRHLALLTSTLQAQFQMTGQQVVLIDQPGSATGMGRRFPSASFRGSVQP